MAKLELSVAVGIYDRTFSIFDGQTPIEGCEINAVPLLPEDLKGRTIGLPEYQLTASVWIRGILQDEHGVRPTDIKWRTGGIEEPGRGERSPMNLPPEIDLQPIPGIRSKPFCAVRTSRGLSSRYPRTRCSRRRPWSFPKYDRTRSGRFARAFDYRLISARMASQYSPNSFV
jgi:hypothetical protein